MSEIKLLIKNILSFYQEKEAKNTTSQVKYFGHTKYDYNSNVTEFEKQTIIKSKLQILDIFVIMELFEIIFNNNYDLFEDFGKIETRLEYYDITIPDHDKKDLQSLKDPFSWIQYMSLYHYYSSMNENDEEEEKEETTVGHLSISKNIPNSEKKFTIDDIALLVDV